MTIPYADMELHPDEEPSIPPLWTDANKLRVLALWFDKWDATDYADRQRLLDEGPGRNDVQRDLRRIADELDAMLGPLPDSPRSGAVIVYVLLALLGVGLVGLGFAAWLATR